MWYSYELSYDCYYLTRGCVTRSKTIIYLTRSKTANEQQRHTGNINGNSRTKTEQEGTRKMTTKRMKIQTQKIVKNQGRKQDGQMEDDQQKV